MQRNFFDGPDDEVQPANRGELLAASGRGYLRVVASDQATQFFYKAQMKQDNRAAVIMACGDRLCEVVAVVNGASMMDWLKVDIAARLSAMCCPFGSVIVTNRQVVCNRMTFDGAARFVEWLAVVLNSPENLNWRERSHKRHSMIAFTRRADGSLRVTAGKKQLDSYWQTSFAA